jgi:hypothetical protein
MWCGSTSWNLFPDFVILWEVGFSRRGAFVCAAGIPLHFLWYSRQWWWWILCCTRKNAASNVLEASQAFLLGPWERRLRESNIQHNERGTCRVLLVLFCTGPMQNFFFLFFLFVCLHLVLCTHQRNSLLLVSYVVFSFSGTHVPLGDFFSQALGIVRF